MQEVNNRSINTPENEFLERKQELFTMNLVMPVQIKEDWHNFKKRCRKLGMEFEDVLGNLIIQFNSGEIGYKGKNPDGPKAQ